MAQKKKATGAKHKNAKRPPKPTKASKPGKPPPPSKAKKPAPKKPAPKKPVPKKPVPKKPAPKKPTAKGTPKSPAPTSATSAPAPAFSYKALPPPRELHRLGAGLAALSVIKGSPKFSVVVLPTLWMFKLDRGNGDTFEFLSTPAGHLVRGFDHESPRSPYRVGHIWPGSYEGLPDGLRHLVEIPAGVGYDGDLFGDAPGQQGRLPPYTFVAWASPGENEWRRGTLAPGAPDSGESFLVGCLDHSIDFGSFDPGLVGKALRNEPLTDADVKKHVRGADLARFRARLEYAAYGKADPFPA